MDSETAVLRRPRVDPAWWGELTLSFVAGYLTAAVVLVCLLIVALGWSPTVVTSDSMSPAIRSGDVVLVDPGATDIGPGAVIQFRDPEGSLMLHRVVDVAPSGEVRTRGDANLQADRRPVAPELILGRGVVLIPALFHPLSGGILVVAAGVGLWRLGEQVRFSRPGRRLVTGGLVLAAILALTVPTTRAAFAASTVSHPSALEAIDLAAPENLVATCQGSELDPSVELTWDHSPTPGITHYEVLHGENAPPGGTPLVTLDASQTSYIHDIPVSLLGTHSYAVTARLDGWVSELSNVDSVEITSLIVGVLCSEI